MLNSHLEIAVASIKCFTDDGQLDLNELNFLLGLALRDNVVDEDEKRVLGSIFQQALSGNVNSLVRDRISEVKRIHEIA